MLLTVIVLRRVAAMGEESVAPAEERWSLHCKELASSCETALSVLTIEIAERTRTDEAMLGERRLSRLEKCQQGSGASVYGRG